MTDQKGVIITINDSNNKANIYQALKICQLYGKHL
jgi:hypothetical protein